MRDRSSAYDGPPLSVASVSPGRVHLWELPRYWYAHGRNTRSGKSASGGPPVMDPERAAYRSRRQVMDATGWLWLKSKEQWCTSSTGKSVRFRQGFWTLTVPEAMPEDAARRALSSYWTWARNVGGMSSYLWVAELTKRGRVHFHYITNDWQDVMAVRGAWHRALRREGLSDAHATAPGNLVDVEPIRSCKKARRYVSKYIGKDFGTRVDQLKERYVKAAMGQDESRPEFLPEIRARLVETIANPRKVQRRWGATIDLERKPMMLIDEEAPQLFRALHTELKSLPGTYFGERSEHGQACHYQLDAVTSETAPVLWSMLTADSC